MGWKLSRIDLTGKNQIKPNEEIDLCIELEKEDRAAIHGVVKFPNGKPVEGAVVKLFKVKKDYKTYDMKCEKKYEDKCEKKYEDKCDDRYEDKYEKEYEKYYKDYDKCHEKECELIPVTFTFTDECGQFLFGVESEKDFVIKVFFFKPEKHQRCHDKK